MKLRLAIPTIALAEAFKQQPTLTEGGKWLWTYKVEAGDNYQVKLYGSAKGDQQVGWEMYLSKRRWVSELFVGGRNV